MSGPGNARNAAIYALCTGVSAELALPYSGKPAAPRHHLERGFHDNANIFFLLCRRNRDMCSLGKVSSFNLLKFTFINAEPRPPIAQPTWKCQKNCDFPGGSSKPRPTQSYMSGWWRWCGESEFEVHSTLADAITIAPAKCHTYIPWRPKVLPN